MLDPRLIHRPFGMCAVQFAVHTDHLRLYPDTKIQSECPDLFAQPIQPVRQLFPVDLPVSERGGVIAPRTKPSVIHNKQFDPRLLCRFCQTQQLMLVNIKISRLPAVEQHRTLLLFPASTDNTLPHKCMHLPAHSIVALFGIGHHRLRCLKDLVPADLIGKRCRMDAGHKAQLSKGIDFTRLVVIAAVDQVESDTRTVILACLCL